MVGFSIVMFVFWGVVAFNVPKPPGWGGPAPGTATELATAQVGWRFQNPGMWLDSVMIESNYTNYTLVN